MRGCGYTLPRCVSIHVPLAEHDAVYCYLLLIIEVSIHVPLAEHDACALCEETQ